MNCPYMFLALNCKAIEGKLKSMIASCSIFLSISEPRTSAPERLLLADTRSCHRTLWLK